MITGDDVVLFQGDSITDIGRSRENQDANVAAALGGGYVFYIAGMLLERHAGSNLAVYNRGLSGNRVTNLAERWQTDTLALEPTVLSILIGVNDTWHGTAKGTPAGGVPLDRYEQIYRRILTDARDGLPGLKLVLCDPFVLPCGAVDEKWFPEFTERRGIVKNLANEFDAVFVPFQDAFDNALQRAAPESWAGDGVHPTIAGHMLMAKTWVQTVCG